VTCDDPAWPEILRGIILRMSQRIPYHEQQYHALMAENGMISQTPEEVAQLGAAIRGALAG
jgi:hypothetical protein